MSSRGVLAISRSRSFAHRFLHFLSRPDRVERDKTPGFFGLKGLHRPEDWDTIARSCVDDCLRLAADIRDHRKSPTVAVLQTFDDMSNRLCSVLDVAELCRNVHPNAEFVKAANEAFLHVISVTQHLNADQSLYEPLNCLYEQHEDDTKNGTAPRHDLSHEDVVMVKSLKRDFESGGINLGTRDKSRLIELQEKVNSLGAQFVSVPVSKPATLHLPSSKLQQLPRQFRHSLMVSSVKPHHVEVPINGSSTHLLLKWVPDSRIREEVFRITHEHERGAKLRTLDDMLQARFEIAHILGQKSYAELLFGERMASSPGDVTEFLEHLSRLVQERAHQERNSLEIEKLRREPHLADDRRMTVFGWDRSFYIGRLKAEQFCLSSSDVSQYLPVSSCLAGLAEIVSNVFGVTLTRVKAAEGEVWHGDVEKLELSDERGCVLGHIFIDLYPRKGKYGHAAHFAIRCGRQPDGASEYQTPVVALVCNFGKGTRNGTRLLTITEYETLFHEFGHSLHSLLSRTKYQHLSGTRVATDFVEVPSHVFEYFAWDPRVISKVAKHYKTGDPMPTRQIQSLAASRKGFIATDIQMQSLFSAMDLQFHGRQPPLGRTTSAFEDLQSRLTVYSPDSGVPIPASFHHFVGYGGGYYSYMFARIISAQLWSSLFERDPFSRRAGDHLRYGILAHGGAHDPSTLITDVLNGSVSCDAFLRNAGIDVGRAKRSLRLPLS